MTYRFLAIAIKRSIVALFLFFTHLNDFAEIIDKETNAQQCAVVELRDVRDALEEAQHRYALPDGADTVSRFRVAATVRLRSRRRRTLLADDRRRLTSGDRV